MREKYLKAIREMLSEMDEKDGRFVYAIVQLIFIHEKD